MALARLINIAYFRKDYKTLRNHVNRSGMSTPAAPASGNPRRSSERPDWGHFRTIHRGESNFVRKRSGSKAPAKSLLLQPGLLCDVLADTLLLRFPAAASSNLQSMSMILSSDEKIVI
jgi:hypothetical protein